MNWREYQKHIAIFFRKLGCDAEVEAKVDGARAKHMIDVWVRFKKFGLETKWVIECKFWNSAVPKEKVLVLRSVVEDAGADKGILISEAGFQSGAVGACKRTNITLTDFHRLKESSQEDLVSSLLHQIETRTIELKQALHNLYRVEQTKFFLIAKPRPGVDGKAVGHATAKLSMLEYGFEQVRFKKTPYPVRFDDTGKTIVAYSLDEFVDQASGVIREVQSILNSQQVAQTQQVKGTPNL
ncbi:MAG: restriction endonuclease [Deltaproteobacteria bacterium]|nr:restriction endonuclease [Deltaproteobacteria bacterium]